MNKKALLLSGGAFRGAVQIPVIEHLINKKSYDAIYGVSVGSLNGVMTAQGDFNELKNIWDSTNSIYDFLDLKWYWPFQGLYSMKPLRSKMEDFISLKKNKVPFYSGIVSGTTGDYFNVSTESLYKDKDLINAVIASSCIAGIMIPQKFNHDGKEHFGFDGGFRNIIPKADDVYDEVDVVICTPLNRIKAKKELSTRNILSVTIRGIEIFQDEILNKDIMLLNDLSASKITIYYPQQYTGGSFYANRDIIKYRYSLGYESTKNPFYLRK
jgi:predicted acylesterase/phospholipase RssA